MSNLSKKIEDILTAATFAEAGEFDTAMEMLKSRQKVLLTLTGKGANEKLFKYAVNICKRINAGLEILSVAATDILLDQFIERLKHEGIEYHVIKREGGIKDAIIELKKRMREINFVVIDSSVYEDMDAEYNRSDKGIAKVLKGLKCPLVVVEA